jgi:hypothetical protein
MEHIILGVFWGIVLYKVMVAALGAICNIIAALLPKDKELEPLIYYEYPSEEEMDKIYIEYKNKNKN